MECCVFFWLSGTMRGPETARVAVHATITAGVRPNEALRTGREGFPPTSCYQE